VTLDIPFLVASSDAVQGVWPFLKASGKFIGICIEVLLLFNLLIFVHELGHFLAAKWRGVYVEEFALWFGKPLWRKKIGKIWYAINSIPAGGYVKLPQMADMSSIEGASENLPPEALKKIKPVDKIIVAFAGPLFSFLLAFAMAVLVWQVGRPESEFDSTIIGTVLKNGPADKAGLKVDDEILEVDGKKVSHFYGTDGVMWAIIRSEGEKIPFVVRRGDQVLTINSGWEKEKTENWRRPSFRKVQISPRYPSNVGFVTRKSPADIAGLKADDSIVEADRVQISTYPQLDPIVTKFAGKDLPITVVRGGERLAMTIAVPSLKDPDGAIDLGIEWGRIRLVPVKPWVQVKDAATGIFRTVGALLSPHSDVKPSHLSGPVGILRLYYQVFEAPEGWRRAFALSVLINVNLALLNLLPFPVLDGGHITLAIVESIRRKPVNIRLMEIVQTCCAILLIGFMIFVTFYDLGDMIGERKSSEKPKAAEQSKE
jgi:regulator of sigma E protease